MFTPQEIQEKTFVKAMFGGYDMASVDDFLEPLTEDYIALYKENAVLKSKMKILVEKLEEYRSQEESMKKALMRAQVTSDQMIADTEKKCAQMRSRTENSLRSKANEAQQQIAAEEERIERAKQAALNFIDVIEKDVSRHIDLLNNLKLMNLGPHKSKAFDFDEEEEDEDEDGAEAHGEEDGENAREIADEIAQNLEKVIGPEEKAQKAEAPEEDDLLSDIPERAEQPAPAERPARAGKPRAPQRGDTARFTNLQFGKNYDPNR